MYCYLYDEYIQGNKRFEKELALIENRLTDLGISGKVSRLALFRNAEEMIRDEIGKGVTTVIVLGNDDTVRKVLNVIAESRVVFGMIPIGPKNELARLMGIPEGVAACDVLSARRVETIDVGLINGRKFITGVRMPQFRAELTCEDQYRIMPTSVAELEIQNLAEVSNPCDGLLQTVIRADVKQGIFGRKKRTESLLPLKFMTIRSDKPICVFADGEPIEGTRFDISVEPLGLKMIIGKDRVFS